MRVLGLAAYPVQGASTRFRMAQYAPLLQAHGIDLQIVPFLDDAAFATLFSPAPSAEKAWALARTSLGYAHKLLAAPTPDVVWVQREAMLIGPEFIELLFALRAPYVFDVDDAIWLPPPREGAQNPAWTRLLRSTRKAERLARRASHVLAGSSHLAEHLSRWNARTRVVPTVPSRERFVPRVRTQKALRIGWIGSHSTAPFVAELVPVFAALRARGHSFSVRMVGAQFGDIDTKAFSLADEVQDLQSFDIGVAPMPDSPWVDGKCGFKQLEYMAVGIPCVTSPWRGADDFIRAEKNALVARTHAEWIQALERLLTDAALRARIGAAGRALVASRMCAEMQGEAIVEILRQSAAARRSRKRS